MKFLLSVLFSLGITSQSFAQEQVEIRRDLPIVQLAVGDRIRFVSSIKVQDTVSFIFGKANYKSTLRYSEKMERWVGTIHELETSQIGHTYFCVAKNKSTRTVPVLEGEVELASSPKITHEAKLTDLHWGNETIYKAWMFDLKTKGGLVQMICFLSTSKHRKEEMVVTHLLKALQASAIYTAE